MRAPPSLSDAQARIRALVTAPEGVAEALRAQGDPGGVALGRLVRGDRGLPAADRLAVYANAYFERLRGALAKDFADLACALGDDGFHDLVRVYLMIHPPHRPSIRDAGADLARFLRDDEVAAPFRRRLPCAADLATFEWAQTEAFDAHDAEPLAARALAAVPAGEWASLRLSTVPALRTLSLAWPVHELPDGAGPAQAVALAPRPARLLVWRRDERVRWREISEREHAALEQLAHGATFGALCEALARDRGDGNAAAEAAAFLSVWLSDGCLRAIAA